MAAFAREKAKAAARRERKLTNRAGKGGEIMPELKPMILIVDDEKTQREGLRAALEDTFEVYLVDSAGAAM